MYYVLNPIRYSEMALCDYVRLLYCRKHSYHAHKTMPSRKASEDDGFDNDVARPRKVATSDPIKFVARSDLLVADISFQKGRLVQCTGRRVVVLLESIVCFELVFCDQYIYH